MKKCDVIIPVYNAPEYTKLCIYNLFKNTNPETLGHVFLINDNSNEITTNLLKNLKEKYKDKIVLINNTTNMGFIKNVNLGFSKSTSDYILLLNTDCLIGHNTIEKLMENMSKDDSIGLMCPISSHAANLTLEMFPGFSYMMMDKLLERKFKGMTFDACTVVGNCLMITKKCIDKVGYFDEIYGMGYCDETDYQFQAMSKGFKAKVAIDTYVYHKAEQSFSVTNVSRKERLEHNRKIFFDRWGDEYYKLLEEYNKNDPVKYIKSHLTEEDKKIKYDYMFVCRESNSTSGGFRVIVDLVNYLSINGLNIGVMTLYNNDYNEIMLFNGCTSCDINNIEVKFLISTIFDSVFFTKKLAEKLSAKIVYFSQGYEFVFENGSRYGEVEVSFKLADYVLTVSNYLKNKYKELLDIDSTAIKNGIDLDLSLVDQQENNRTICMVIRNSYRKADYILLDLIKHITKKFKNVTLNLIINNDNISFPVNNNDSVTINKYYGPLTRVEIYDILKESDIFIDTSLSEGFGLMPLEAMANATVPIISNSFGINEYAVDSKNAFIIKEVNNPDLYIKTIEKLLSDDKLMKQMKKEGINTAKKFDFDEVVDKYVKYFDDVKSGKVKPIVQEITSNDLEKLANYMYNDTMYDERIADSIAQLGGQVEQDGQVVLPKQSRLKRFLIIFRESVRANVYLFKLFIKNIFDKNLRL